MIPPPGIDNGAFVVSPESVLYARVLLLFSASAKTDTGSKSFDCALMSTMETYDDPENSCYMYYMYYINNTCYMYHMHYMYGKRAHGKHNTYIRILCIVYIIFIILFSQDG